MSIAVLLLLLLSIFQVVAQPSDFSHRIEKVSIAFQRTTRRVAKAFQSESLSRITIRDVSTAALANLGTGGSVNLTKTWLRAVLKTQNSITGKLPWDFTGNINDANSIEFGVQAWGPIVINYPTQMSDFMSEFLPHIRLAVKALQSHQRTTSTTNIHLSNIVSQLLLGEVLQDDGITQNATTLLRIWAHHTQVNGLNEFDSPTYYGEDLNALALGYACTKVAAARDIIHWALRYLWTDIAANWFNPQHSLSGPHSRDHDFLLGNGEIYSWLYAEGWIEELNRAKEVKYFLVEALNTSTAFHPGNDIRELALLPYKLVVSRQPPVKQKRNLPVFIRTNRITPDFAIGSIDLNYGSQDKLVTWHLGTNSSQPVITITPDASNSPYGKVSEPDKNGHMKPLHLLLNPSIVQSDTAMLILLDLHPTAKSTVLKSLVTNIILPASADDILRNGMSILSDFFTMPTIIPVSTNEIITVRSALGCVAFRIFYVTPIVGNYTPSLVLQSEALGLSVGAVRLAIYHTPPDLQNVTLPPSSHIRVGIISLSQHCETPGDTAALSEMVSSAKVSTTFNNMFNKNKPGTWVATVQFPAVHLSVAKSMGTDRATIFRRVNGSDLAIPPNGTIIVNGITLDPAKNLGPQFKGNGIGNGLVESKLSDTAMELDYSNIGEGEGWQQNVIRKLSPI